MNDDTISKDVKEYLKYLDLESGKKIFLIQKDDYLSYIKISSLNDELQDSIAKSTCNPIIKVADGTIYFSGDNNCINFNYVWYSGKLWRITAIYVNIIL